MGQLSKQAAICACLLLCVSPYTMIATFYPQIASSKGIPLWVIGAVFAADPISSLFISLLLGKYMLHIGRKLTIITSLLLAALSMCVLSPIERVSSSTSLILSFASRILAGMSTACVMTAGDSVIVSDYPDNIETMVGRLEGFIGIGLIIGPLIGTLVYMWDLLYSLIILAGLLLAFGPPCWKMLGEFRDYEISNSGMSSTELMLKPVR